MNATKILFFLQEDMFRTMADTEIEQRTLTLSLEVKPLDYEGNGCLQTLTVKMTPNFHSAEKFQSQLTGNTIV